MIPTGILVPEILTLLRGVIWPTASVLLYFGSKDTYPILDIRALSTLQASVPKQYHFSFWWSYTEYCRTLAETAGVRMPMLDRALWQFSKDYQVTLAIEERAEHGNSSSHTTDGV